MSVTKGSDNEFPSVLLAEQGSDPATPAAGNQRLFVDSADGLLKLIDDTGTVTEVGGSTGLADPMTTRGDIIIRNASNVTARLGRGSAGKVLTSDGTDVSWQTPASGGSATTQARINYAAGSISLTASTSTHTEVSSALRLTIAAAAGDILLIGADCLMSPAAGGEASIDFVTIVSSAIVNRVGSGGTRLGLGYVSAATTHVAPNATYVVQSGDISGGNVVVSISFVNTAGSAATLFATSTHALTFYVINLHH